MEFVTELEQKKRCLFARLFRLFFPLLLRQIPSYSTALRLRNTCTHAQIAASRPLAQVYSSQFSTFFEILICHGTNTAAWEAAASFRCLELKVVNPP
jgi:hypothetical protein